MKLDEVESLHSGGITASSTQQHPSDHPRHLHWQVSTTKLQNPTNLVCRIGISAGVEEQLHDG
jgi:hypothetical protein